MFSLNNPLRYMDPDGLQPRTLQVEVRDFSGSNPKHAEARAAAKQAIAKLPQSKLAKTAAKANVKIGRPQEKTDSGKSRNDKTMTFTLIDSSNKTSMDKGEKVGEGFSRERQAVDQSPGSFIGVSNRAGDALVFVDKLQSELNRMEMKNFFDDSLSSKQQKYVDNVIQHETGHNMGSPDFTGDGSLMDDSAASDPDNAEANLPLEDTRGEGFILDHLWDQFPE